MEIKELTLKVKEISKSYGFSKVGITQAVPIPKEKSRLKDWIDSSYHADMHWINKRFEERSNIISYYPFAKSVISLATNYFTGINESNNESKISNYAWGDDYHKVIKPRLYSILNEIKLIMNDVEGVVCVDTSPVMEKVWAQKAGLGWIGKHTNLISRDFGSWIFLSEIILNIDLEKDKPFIEDLCGTCVACIDACPTNALSDYVLDSNKCISYHTIEHKGSFDSITPNPAYFSGYIYGCDICQEVCPWNIKFSRKSNEPLFQKREMIEKFELIGWDGLNQENFRETFKNSAVKRTKFFGLQRNINYIKGKC